jgi:hypothetical protein
MKFPDDDRLMPKHVGASILNKGVVQFSAYGWLFSTKSNNARYEH